MKIFRTNKTQNKRGIIKRELPKGTQERISKRSFIKGLHKTPDLNLVFITILFLICGLLMIFSASALSAYVNYGDTFYFLKKQILWVIAGTFAAYIFYVLPIEVIKRLSVLMLAVGILLLLYILPEAVMGLDANGNPNFDMPFVLTKNGATRWIDLVFFDLQPAEFVKFSFVIYISAWLTKPVNVSIKNANKVKEHVINVVLPFLVLLGIISVLILAQKDLDTTVILVLTIIAIYYSAANDLIHTVGSIVILASSVLFGVAAMLLEEYRRIRVLSFLNIFRYGRPDSEDTLQGSFQVWNGLVALGSGGLFGLGYGQSVIKQGFLQEAAYTDSIFAVIGEEFGFVGAILVILGFLYFASIGYGIANRAEDKFTSLLAIGMTSWIVIQALLNIAANLSAIPFGGMPLPFFSYGGSSTISIMMAIGILANISKHSKN